jgi:phosphohistidine swiveling domain-containing protein
LFPTLGGSTFSLEIGGRKATPLHELMRAGFPVPPGFVVAADADLNEAELDTAVQAIGGYPVAARSSGHLEDLPGASFAGQYVTHLGVTNASALAQAIRDCRHSATSDQVVAYLRRQRLDESQTRVSVLVQAMVDASIAGVAFSIHPLSGREEHALLECCRGLGEKLVSGRTAPSRYVIRLEDASVVEWDPGGESARIDDETVTRLRQYILELQAHFGCPQDIEWAIDRSGRLWLLQSRPITRVEWRTDIPEFTSADFREGGVSARVCTPLMYSLYRDALQSSMQRYFVAIKLLAENAPERTWIAMFYGRPYWSASAVKSTLVKTPGFDEEVFDRDLGIRKNYGERGPARTPMSLRRVLPAVPVAIALERNYHGHLRRTEGYGRRFLPQESKHLAIAATFERMDDETFFASLADVFAFQLATEVDYFTTIYNNANLQSDLKKLLKRIERSVDFPISAVALMSGLQDVSHMKIQRDILQLVGVARRDGVGTPAWDRALASFLAENYFHADAELDISTPRWGERPERVTQIVQDILRSKSDPKDPDAAARSQFERFEAEQNRILLSIQRSIVRRLRFGGSFRKRLRLARAYLSRREEMREFSTRAYNVVRVYVMEAGRRLERRRHLETADDVFMMHTDEFVAVGRSDADPRRTLETTGFRRLMYRGYRSFEPPGELGRDVTQERTAVPGASEPDSMLLRGIGCSSGIVKATVRIVPTLDDAAALRAGEILVTRFTDPGWTPVLGLVSGIVTEVGGLLSHAAVIGREYGIPAVLNVAGATQVLRNGQLVEIDGTAGTVRILAPADP